MTASAPNSWTARTWTALVNPVAPTGTVPGAFYEAACELGRFVVQQDAHYLGVCGQTGLSAQVEYGVLQELRLQKNEVTSTKAILASTKPLLYLRPPQTELPEKAVPFIAAVEAVDNLALLQGLMLDHAAHVVALPCTGSDMQRQALDVYEAMCATPSAATLYLLNTQGCYKDVYGDIFRDSRRNPAHRDAANHVMIVDTVDELRHLTDRPADLPAPKPFA